ncbi:DUF6803 family protein [Planomonospora corallina]|uniref:DUF6803 family protein n=1 Tax=Planomonospora corallina TaxID=1806052 RepID=A0ABV8I6V4_9ACTN
MSAIQTRPTLTAPAAHRPGWALGAAVTGAAVTAAAGGAFALPDLPTGGTSVAMTHYMELLATNQPWNLLMFMAVPVVLAETVAITELAILFRRDAEPWVKALSRWAGIIGGLYFLVVFGYLLVNAAIPLTTGGGWRGPVDVIAVGGYLSGAVPLFGIALLELRVLGRGLTDTTRLKWHAAFVGLFLVVAHIAMIFGMLDPTLFGYHTPGHTGMNM